MEKMSAINYEADITAPNNKQLEEISKLALLQNAQQQEVALLETKLQEAQKRLRRTQEQDLPEAMKAAGLEMFKTFDGLEVSIDEKLYASIPKKHKSEAIRWLMDHDLSSLVKEDVNIPFDKGDHTAVQELVNLLEMTGYDTFSVEESVNTGSVKATIKELLDTGVDVPLELFGAYFHRKAVIKQ